MRAAKLAAVALSLFLPLLMISCGGGGGGSTPSPPSPDFGMTTSPSSTSVQQGATGSVTVSVIPRDGFSGTVSITLSGFPAGVTAPALQVQAGASGSFVVSVASSVPVGTYNGTIQGTSGALSHGASLTLTVTAVAPPKPTCVLNANPASITQGSSSTLSWSSTDAVSASLDQGIGSVPVSGSKIVTPSATTTYTLTVANSSGSGTCQATVTVTAPQITLGNGSILYVPNNDNGLFPASSQQCFTSFMSFVAPLRNTLFGQPDTANLTVTVKIDSNAQGGAFLPASDTMLLGRAPTCQAADANVLGISSHEDGHASHRSWLRLPQQVPPLGAYRDEGMANALSVLVSIWAREKGWQAGALDEDAILGSNLLNRLAPELVAGPGESSHPDPVANSMWMRATTALHLQATFANSTGSTTDISQWDSALKRWNEARYAFVNQNQRLPNATEDDQLLASVSPNPIDGKGVLAWLGTQIITTPLANLKAGTYVGLFMPSPINPLYVDVPIIIRDASGNESTATSGSATLQIFAANGTTKVCSDAVLDLSQTHEYTFTCGSTQLAEGVYVAKVSTTIAGVSYSAVSYFVIATQNGKTASGWPGIYIITRDASGTIVDAQVTALDGSVKRLVAGLFLATPSDTTQLPMRVSLQASTQTATITSTFTVPPLKWWTTVGIADIR